MSNLTSVHTLLSIDRQAIWGIDNVTYNVAFADGITKQLSKKHIIFNRYCWDLFTLYPSTPITSVCDVTYILNGESLTADTHIKLLETIFKHICEFNNINKYSDKAPLLLMVYRVVNNIFNEIINNISQYVSTIDAIDFIEVINDKAISDIHANVKPTPDGMDRAYKQIKQALFTTLNPDNRFVKAYRSKAVNENQANQCIGPRGFVTDLDRTVFKQPIMNGFIKGMGNLYELMTESRTAAKSLNANDTHIKTSEYASRRLQLLSMVVTNVVNGDCGSQEYMELQITQPILDNIKGKYYLKDDGTIDHIRGSESHLIGTTTKIRTILGCHHPDPSKVCTTCLGKISENFKENSNIGYIMTSHLMEKSTQSILSTKHLTHSVRKSAIKLNGSANKYFYVTDDGNLLFNPELDLSGLTIILPNAKLGKLVDVLNTKHGNIALAKIGELDEVIIKDSKHKTPLTETITISYNDRASILTKAFLDHIRSVKLDCDARGNFLVPLDTFNKNLPIFNCPLKESNIISFVNKITSLIETNKVKADDPYEKLYVLFMHILEQLKCNMTIIEVIIYATTSYNSADNNYKLGRNSLHAKCESKGLLYRHRSLSQLLVFEEQLKELISNAPIMFNSKNRCNHPMDILLVPQSLVK